MNYVVLDFEASSLSQESYPIEVAWGNAEIGVESYLIDPKDIPLWSEWGDEAEEIHGISRQTLLTKGVSPAEIHQKLVSVFSQYQVYSDFPSGDQHWLNKLSRAAGGTQQEMRLLNVEDLLGSILSERGASKVSIHEIIAIGTRNCPATHRAAQDVRSLLACIDAAETIAL